MAEENKLGKLMEASPSNMKATLESLAIPFGHLGAI